MSKWSVWLRVFVPHSSQGKGLNLSVLSKWSLSSLSSVWVAIDFTGWLNSRLISCKAFWMVVMSLMSFCTLYRSKW